MVRPSNCARRSRQIAGLGFAFGLALTGLLIATTGEQRAEAAELVTAPSFEQEPAGAGAPLATEGQSPADFLNPAMPSQPALVDATPDEVRDLGSGMASYYGTQFAGNRTASGERFDPASLTAAHPDLPFGSKVKVTSRTSGKSVIVRINDRGPFHGDRVIDLSRAAASEIGLTQQGKGMVRLALLSD